MKRRPFTRRRFQTAEAPLPERKYKAIPITRDREEWHVEYDLIGNRAVGSLYQEMNLRRRIFNVKTVNGIFAVDIGTGSGVKIAFKHGE